MFDLYRIQYALNILNITSAVRAVTETIYTQMLILQISYDYFNNQIIMSIYFKIIYK